MATVDYEYFSLTPADLANNHNRALEATMHQLVSDGLLTLDQAEKFSSEYTFVAVRSSSVTSRIKKWLFPEKDKEDCYKFPLVKIK